MKALLIQVPAAGQNHGLVHDLRNAAEDIYRQFMAGGIVEIPDMDSAVTEIHVLVSAPRHLGDVSLCVKKTLKRYRLTELATVSRISAAEYAAKPAGYIAR